MVTPAAVRFPRAYQYLAHYAAVQPQAEALVSGRERWSYAALQRRVDGCARALLAQGVRAGDRIAYLTPPNAEFVALLLAAQAVGGIAVGLNLRYRQREIAHILQDAAPKLLFCRLPAQDGRELDDLAAGLNDLPEPCRLVELGEGAGSAHFSTWESFLASASSAADLDVRAQAMAVDPDAPSLIVYTSGTTGAPKGALLRQSAALRHGRLALAAFRPQPLRVLNYYPTNHISGLVANTLYALVGGGALVCMERFHPAQVLAAIEAERITYWGGVPTMLQMCVADERFAETDLSSLQLAGWGGGPAAADLIRALAARVPRLTTLYAMTETTGAVTAIAPTANIDLLARTVGKPLPDVEMRLVDDAGADVGSGEAGEILVRGPFLMAGYWGNPEATKRAFTEDGWLYTGDLARFDAEGFVEIVGRKTEMYKSGGFNVYPKEVEAVIGTHPKVRDAAVVGVRDDLFGEVGVAFVLADFPAAEQGEAALAEHCRQGLANYKVPKRFRLVDALPLLPNGKVDRKALVEGAKQIHRPTAR